MSTNGKENMITGSIVVYRNDADEVRRAIRSFLSSGFNPSLYVIDNSPDDALRDAVVGEGADYIFTGKNLGFGAAHNLAVCHCIEHSRYHLVINPDIYFDSAILGELVTFMNAHPDVGLVMPTVLFPDGSEQRLCKRLPTPFDLFLRRFLGDIGKKLFRRNWDRYEVRDLDLSIAREIPCLSGCCMFLRSETLRDIGGFDERYFMYLEDVDLCRRIAQRAKTAFYPHVCVEHGYAKGSYRDGRLFRYHLSSAFRYFCKWGWIQDPERKLLNNRTKPV